MLIHITNDLPIYFSKTASPSLSDVYYDLKLQIENFPFNINYNYVLKQKTTKT